MIKNIISTFFTRSTIAIILLINLIITSRFLGSEILGQVSTLLLNVAIAHTVAEIYSGSALVYFIPRASLRMIYRTGFIWIIFCTLILNAIFYVFEIGNKNFAIHVFILSFLTSLHAFQNLLLLGKERIKEYNFLLFFQPASFLAALAFSVFYMDNRTLNASIFALYFSYLLSVLFSGIAVATSVKDCQNPQPLVLKDILKNGFINQLGNLSHILSNRFNFYIIQSISFSLVGVYAGATSLVESIWIISASVSPLILTHIANGRDVSNNSKVTFLLAKLCFIFSLLCILVLYLVPSEFFTMLLGKDFSEVKSVMLWLSPGVLAISFSSILSHYFSGLGQQKILLLANGSGFVVTLLLSYFLVSRYGILGACYTASLAYLAQAFVLTVVFMRRNHLKISSFFSMKRDLALLK